MNDFTTTDLASLIQEYLTYCEVQKRLDEKTLKAYRIDLRQFREQLRSDQAAQIARIDSTALEQYATSLLEADVNIRYIQEMLGHSSIHITEIYTHVAVAKQRAILAGKHPRKDFRV